MDVLQGMQSWLSENQRALEKISRLLDQGNSNSFIPGAQDKTGNRSSPIPFPRAEKKISYVKKPDRKKEQDSHSSGTARYFEALDISRYTAASLTREDLHTLIGLYGSTVEDIYELGAGQRWMLETGKNVKSAFFLQVLTRAVIPLDSAVFRQKADEVCAKQEYLRSAFVLRNVSQPYRVVLTDRHPEINYYDLSMLSMEEFEEKVQKMADGDRLRGFDLEKDSLLRINVYKSCQKDTYALVVSQPHVNTDGMSVNLLIRDLFFGYALDMNGVDKQIEAQTYQSYAEHLQNVDLEKELDYWKMILKDAQEDQLLPGQQKSELDFNSAHLFVPFGEGMLEHLKAAQKTLKVTQYTILQGIWGVMVCRLKGRNSVVFGAVIAGRDAEVADSYRIGGGFVNAIPVKVQFGDDDTFLSFVRRMQENTAEAMKNSHCSPEQIRKALGRKTPVFSHILDNHNVSRKRGGAFREEGIPGVKLLGIETYDNLAEDLCVFFTAENGIPGCRFVYNERVFSKEIIQLLGESLQQAMTILDGLTEETTIRAFPKTDASLILAAAAAKQSEHLKIAGMMKKHPVFSGVKDEELLALAQVCSLNVYAEDETILLKDSRPEDVPFLVNGTAMLYGETASGWINPVQGMKNGSILTILPLFEDIRMPNTVMSNEDGTLVLFVPGYAMRAFCMAHPESLLQILRMLYDSSNKYMKLWMNA